MASKGWNYRTAYFMDFDGKYYKTTISVAQGADGSVIYNVGQMQERSAPKIDGSSGKTGALRGNASKNSIRQSSENSQGEKSGGTKFSLREQFPSEIDQWNRDGRPEGERFTLGSTGPVLQGLGAIESDIYMEGDKISTILRKHPEMTLAEIKKIPRILEDPALVLKSKARKSSIVVLGTYRAQNGKPILAAMDLRPREKGFVNTNGVPFSSVVKISEDGGEGTLYSRREKYWRPSLSGEEWSLLNRRMSEEIESGENFVDESTKWVYADEKDVQVFALYGVGDGTEATPLYAVGGKKAASAAANMKEFENGGYQHDGNTETALSWIRSVSRSQGNGRGSIRETSRGGEASANDGLYGFT